MRVGIHAGSSDADRIADQCRQADVNEVFLSARAIPEFAKQGYLNSSSIEASVEYGQMMSLSFNTDTVIGFHPCLDDCDGDGTARDLQITWTGLEAHDQTTGYGHLVLSSEIPTAVSASGKLATTWSYLKTQ